MALEYDRRRPNTCKALGNATEAWFYVQDGSIVIVCHPTGGQAVLTRRQLQAALKAMRPLRKR